MKLDTKRILLIIESSTSYGREILHGISQFAREKNNWWFLVELRGIEESPPLLLKNWKGDGIISRVSNSKTFRLIQQCDCPYVDLLWDFKNAIKCEDLLIAKKFYEYFISLGFQHFGFFSFGKTEWIQTRKQVVLEEGKQLDLTIHTFEPSLIKDDMCPEPQWNDYYEKQLICWLHSLPKPIAILAANDHQAVHLLNYCIQEQINIPDEIAILGINNDDHLCNIVSPSLSSIDPNAFQVGYEAARMLDHKINFNDLSLFERRTIEPKGIIVRQSTETLMIDNADIIDAIRFIRKYATQGIRVCDVLEEVQLSNKTLERWFKKTLGHTPEREIILVKLRHAESLLRNTQMSIRKIAELSGFQSERYFVQFFRREKGLTPYQFRKNIE
ncbi:MAG: DNA-binding transcriptional regulator [Planctomycetia bacterium]|nr:DNA-binding transcriptional regulator [Planctomycetia bacterium]